MTTSFAEISTAFATRHLELEAIRADAVHWLESRHGGDEHQRRQAEDDLARAVAHHRSHEKVRNAALNPPAAVDVTEEAE